MRNRLFQIVLLIGAFIIGGSLFLWFGASSHLEPAELSSGGVSVPLVSSAPLPPVGPHLPPKILSGRGVSDSPSTLFLLPSEPEQKKPKEAKKNQTDHLPQSSSRPQICVVIDDVGPAHKAGLEVVALPPAVVVAVLPYAEKAEELANKAHLAGHEVLVHMPMEPDVLKGNNPGPQALFLNLSPDEIKDRTRKAFLAVPHAIGLNNHMGSAFTANAEKLLPVMQVLRDQNKLFLDSRTTPQSKALEVAQRLGLDAYTRDVFIDDDISPSFILGQFAAAEARARKKGHAILIGHPHALTLALLKPWLASLKAKGIDLVPLTALPLAPENSRP